MKAIIDGKRYNTETAILIGESGYNGSRSDFQWWAAGLYKTPRSGKYFLAGKGGPMSMFCHACDGGGWSGGEKIIPLDCGEALAWAERELDHAVIEDVFADSIEDA